VPGKRAAGHSRAGIGRGKRGEVELVRTNSRVAALEASLSRVPIGDFQDGNASRHFRDRVKGAFWANFLGAAQIAALGGRVAVRADAPCWSLEDLAEGGMLLVRQPGSLDTGEGDTVQAHEQLAQYLARITIDGGVGTSSALRGLGRAWRVSHRA
jgi:hypothetical protein